jgi:hypothetical protein
MVFVECEDIHCIHNRESVNVWNNSKQHYCGAEKIYISDDGCISYEARKK